MSKAIVAEAIWRVLRMRPKWREMSGRLAPLCLSMPTGRGRLLGGAARVSPGGTCFTLYS